MPCGLKILSDKKVQPCQACKKFVQAWPWDIFKGEKTCKSLIDSRTSVKIVYTSMIQRAHDVGRNMVSVRVVVSTPKCDTQVL